MVETIGSWAGVLAAFAALFAALGWSRASRWVAQVEAELDDRTVELMAVVRAVEAATKSKDTRSPAGVVREIKRRVKALTTAAGVEDDMRDIVHEVTRRKETAA